MDEKELAVKVVDTMYKSDWFSQWLGIQVLDVWPGGCKLRMSVRKEMLNGMGMMHGGVSFSFADSALAFSCNSRGKRSVSIETSISHTEAVQEGEELTAVAEELTRSNKIGVYQIIVTNRENRKVGLFKGMVYRTSKDWFPEDNKE